MSRHNILCHDRVLPRLGWLRNGNSCHNRMLLCHDKDVQHGENLCLGRVFLLRDRKSQDIKFPCRDIALYVTTMG